MTAIQSLFLEALSISPRLRNLSWSQTKHLSPSVIEVTSSHSNILRNLSLQIIVFWAPPHGSTLAHSRCRCTPRHHPAPDHTQLRYPRPPQMNVSQGPFSPTPLGVSLKEGKPEKLELPLAEVNRKELPACAKLWPHGKKQTRVVEVSLVLY